MSRATTPDSRAATARPGSGRGRKRRAKPPARKRPLTEDEVEQELLAEGVIDQAPPLDVAARPSQSRKLIRVRGRPTSEIIIEERR